MSLTIETITRDFKEMNKLTDLYCDSFPKHEQFPIWFLLWKSKKNFVDYLAFYDNDVFIGFSYLITDKDLTFVLYLAIDENIRSHGYGKKVLMRIKEKYPNNKIILSIESVEKTSINYEQRIRRENFYLNNDYRYLNYRLIEKDSCYDFLINGKSPSIEECNSLFKKFAGTLLFLLFKPKLIYTSVKSTM